MLNTFWRSAATMDRAKASRTLRALLVLVAMAGSSSMPCHAQTPEWIWHPNQGAAPKEGEVRWFRKTFVVQPPVARARLVIAADNAFEAHLNEVKVATGSSWESPERADVTRNLRTGTNVLAIRATNREGSAGLLVRLEINSGQDQRQIVLSDASWRTSEQAAPAWTTLGFSDATWTPAKVLGKVGIEPWGNIFAGGNRNQGARIATPAENLKTLPGFKADLVHAATSEEGSWICMAFDPQGRVIISPQNSKQPFLRYTLDAQGHITRKEILDLGLGEAMGLLHAFDSLYANCKGPEGTGLYRLRDTNGDDTYDQIQFLKTFEGGGEHGPHGMALGPDQKIYIMNGNHTKVPHGLAPTSPHRDYAEDLLLPRAWDGNGHARGILAPGGYVVRTDAQGQSWELVLAGFRNAYDLDFNQDGELFTYDSDMEWDWGMPWYRPTAVYHCVSGGDYGWRSGTGKWPWYYPDALPPLDMTGIGSPTGVKVGKGAAFPERYQRALYVLDWTYGRIFALHLAPQGATYTSQREIFVAGTPLNVSDIDIGRDGALYFITGGRGTQSGLYRVTYSGHESTRAVSSPNTLGAEDRSLRRKLESFHGLQNPAAIDTAWPQLDSPDRFIRHAARIAIESQPVGSWQDRALDESRPRAALTALTALARKGDSDQQQRLFEALERLQPATLPESQQLEVLRIASLSCLRMGPPDPDLARDIIQFADALYPTPSENLNRELSQLLIFLEAPDVVSKTLDLMAKAPSQEEQIHYLVSLRSLKNGWTLDQRRQYFTWYHQPRAHLTHPPEVLQWFAEAGRPYSDGASFPKFLENFKRDAIETLSESDRVELAAVLSNAPPKPATAAPAPRAFVRDWKLDDLLPTLEQASRGRSFAKGRQAFADAQCLACHKFGNEGGATGQDLSAVASRYTLRDILESILDPSKVLSEQYQNTTFQLKNDEDITGRVIDERQGKLVILIDPIQQTTTEISPAEIRSQSPSKISPMPQGLLNGFPKEEILDLLAYLQSGGRSDVNAFK